MTGRAGRRIRRGALFGAGLGALLAGAALYYAREVEPEDVEIVSTELVLPRLDERFDGYRIAHISDVHADGWMTAGRLLRLVGLVNAEAPDLVAITGDFATYSPLFSLLRHVPGLAAPLRRLRAPGGTVAVLGNHDHKPDVRMFRWTLTKIGLAGDFADKARVTARTVRRMLAAGGIVELNNTVRTVRRGDAALHLGGVDSIQEGADDLERVLRELPEGGAAILLAHEPDFADASGATRRFDLQLSGHSHGGQARLPLVGPAVLPPLSHKYPSGLYRVGGMFLYTNRGLGAHPRLRFNCRPEITILTLRSP